jgi:NAD(P)H-dependent FMN reductase
MKILAIGGSNSVNSINRQLAEFTATLFSVAEIDTINVSTIDIPIYSISRETDSGIPEQAITFSKQIDVADLLVVSLAENNGSYNAGFKNLLDWTSRIPNRKIFGNKPVLLLSTSPGPRGGASVLAHANATFPHLGAQLKGSFSLPEFYKNFQPGIGIIHPNLLAELKALVDGITEN